MVLVSILPVLVSIVCRATVPQDNPVATRYPHGVIPARMSINGFKADTFPWTNVVSIADIDGNFQNDPAELFKAAAAKALKANPAGGVVFFPSGKYKFSASLELGTFLERVLVIAGKCILMF